MTVSTTTPTITYNYTGPGTYGYPYLAYKDTDIQVTYTDTAGLASILVQGVDYTVSLNPDFLGGTVTTTTPLDTDGALVIRRELPLDQPVDWVNNDPLDAETLERSFDRLTMMMQQLDVTVEDGSTITTWRGDWVGPGQVYNTNDITISPDKNWYVCIVPHTSTADFATDLAGGNWLLAYDVSVIETYRDEAQLAASDASAAKDTATTQATASAASAAEAETHKNAAQTAEANSAENAQNSANCRQEAYDQAVIATDAAASIPDPATLVKQTSATGAAQIPAGTTAQTPGTPSFGQQRADSDVGKMLWYNGSEWTEMGGGGAIPWEAVQTTNFVVEAGKAYPVDCSGGDIIVDASNLSEDDWFILGDAGYTWGQGTGKCYLENDGVIPIYTSATDDFVMNEQNAVYVWQYRDATRGWMIYDGIGESAPEGSSITTIWTGSAGNGVTIDWSGTGYVLSQFDAILVTGLFNSRVTSQLFNTTEIINTGSLTHSYFTSTGTGTNQAVYYLNSITDTSVVTQIILSGWTGTFTGIYGIKYN